MADLVRGFRAREVFIEAWGADLLFMVNEDSRVVYVPIRPLCSVLGIDAKTQIERIKTDEQYEDAIEELKVPTAGGRQDTLCLRSKEAAMWVLSIAPRRLPEHLRERHTELRETLLIAADRLLFGDLSEVVRSGQLQLGRPARGELTFACPRCGAPLCFVVEGTSIHLRVDRG